MRGILAAGGNSVYKGPVAGRSIIVKETKMWIDSYRKIEKSDWKYNNKQREKRKEATVWLEHSKWEGRVFENKVGGVGQDPKVVMVRSLIFRPKAARQHWKVLNRGEGNRVVRFVFWKDHLGHCVQNILEKDQKDGLRTMRRQLPSSRWEMLVSGPEW